MAEAGLGGIVRPDPQGDVLIEQKLPTIRHDPSRPPLAGYRVSSAPVR